MATKDLENSEETALAETENNNDKKKQLNAILLIVTIISLACFLLYSLLIVSAFARADMGDDSYYAYATAGTLFVFIMTLVFTINAGLFLRSIRHARKTFEISNWNNVNNSELRITTVKERSSIENMIQDVNDISENTFLSIIGIYIFLTFLFLGITSFACAIVVLHYHQKSHVVPRYAYIIVEFTSGLLPPILILSSITLFMVVVSYYTKNRLSMRNVIPKLFNSLTLEQHISSRRDVVSTRGKYGSTEINGSDVAKIGMEKVEYEYWEIQGIFKWDICERKNWYRWLEPHISTWIFWVIICISTVVAYVQFIEAVVVAEKESSICLPEFNCFMTVDTFDFQHFSCDKFNSSTLNGSKFHCFRFREFKFDSKVLLAAGNAYALYLIQIALFGKIISSYHTFLNLKLDVQFISIFILIPLVWPLAVYAFNLAQDYQEIVYDVLHTWNIFNILFYQFVVGIFLISYRWQKQWKCYQPDSLKKSAKKDAIALHD